MSTARYKIVLIEDDELQVQYIRELLPAYSEGSLQIDWADCLAKGIDLLSTKEYDVILLDMNLPDSLGLEGLEKIAPLAQETAIVLLTGVDDEKLAIQALQSGAQDYLVKGQADGRCIARAVRYAVERTQILANLEWQKRDLEKTGKALSSKNRELEQAYSELKNTQSQLLQQAKMASIGQLAAGLAHEINNPMGFITSNLNTLGRYVDRLVEFLAIQSDALQASAPLAKVKKLNLVRKKMKVDYIREDAVELLAESLEGALRVKEIVGNLKNFSRTDEAKIQETDINASLESALKIVWNELKDKARVIREFSDLPMVRCNTQQINLVFLNLLVNAADAIPKQGEITLKTRQEGDVVLVSVSDTGIGIPARIRERVFEPFFTNKGVGNGIGLGLSMSYDIVKKHGGELTLESKEGKGTTFTVRLPVSGNATTTSGIK
ncbi:MAG: response regulator [Desulfobulbaceae bacterium]|nr:response regulator [Desulfobulbaceae bacterium]